MPSDRQAPGILFIQFQIPSGAVDLMARGGICSCSCWWISDTISSRTTGTKTKTLPDQQQQHYHHHQPMTLSPSLQLPPHPLLVSLSNTWHQTKDLLMNPHLYMNRTSTNTPSSPTSIQVLFQKQLFFSVGINDRQYVNFTIRIHLDKMMSAAEKTFPKSQIYFSALNNFNVSSPQQANLRFLINLSSYSLNQNEISVMDKGLKFVLTSLQISKSSISEAVYELSRQI